MNYDSVSDTNLSNDLDLEAALALLDDGEAVSDTMRSDVRAGGDAFEARAQ